MVNIIANDLTVCTHKYLSNLLTTHITLDERFPIGVLFYKAYSGVSLTKHKA